MPVPGLSLFGFMDESEGVQYLKRYCTLDDASDGALQQMWREARTKLGGPIARAGQPEIQEIPPAYQAYLERVQHTIAFQGATGGIPFLGFYLVEIAPLLAYQFSVTTDAHDEIVASGSEPDADRILRGCLPDYLEVLEFEYRMTSTEFWIDCPDLNLQTIAANAVVHEDTGLKTLGVLVGQWNPLVQVARYRGRFYLRNGFHRAYQLQCAGVPTIPCLVVDATTEQQVGINPGTTFDSRTLDSPMSPTCGHLTDSRAWAVSLRRAKRVIHVTWSQSVALGD